MHKDTEREGGRWKGNRGRGWETGEVKEGGGKGRGREGEQVQQGITSGYKRIAGCASHMADLSSVFVLFLI